MTQFEVYLGCAFAASCVAIIGLIIRLSWGNNNLNIEENYE